MNESGTNIKLDTGKPFKLVKYFSATSLVIIVVFSVTLSAFLADRSKIMMLERYEEYAEVLAANLNHQVFQQFVLPTAAIYGGIDLSSEYQQKRLDKLVRSVINKLNVDQINIYDVEGTLVYTTGDGVLGERGELDPGFKEAAIGRPVSMVNYEGSLIDYIIHGRLSEAVKLKTLTPFRAERLGLTLQRPRPILAVFELVTDLTPEMNEIFKHQVIAGATATGLMGIMFLFLTLIVRNGENILLARAEERKKLEVKLQEAERLAALGRMVASVSHEIKSPLGIIRSTGELIASQMDKDDSNRPLTGVIVEECTRLNRIVMEFLDFARPQVPNLQDIDLNDLINRILETLKPNLEEHSITIEKNVDKVLYIKADPDMIYRALLNVLVNAVQAMPKGGIIDVSARANGYYGCVVEIKDTGDGISEESAERVFEPFFTLKEQGSGLGLAIVKSIIEAHDGTIELTSEPGNGARVKIKL